jgi:hypothetical protein
MKKLVLFTLILLCAFTFDSSAQRKRKRTATSQGNWVLRFGMGFNSDRTTNDFNDLEQSRTDFTFNPTLTYMVIDNLEVGVNVGIMNENTRNETGTNNRTETSGTDVSFGLFAQKYFPLNNWFAFHTNANIGLLTGNRETDNIVGSSTSTTGADRNGVMGGINFGFTFTPYNSFALYSNFAGLGIGNVKENPDGPNNSTSQTHSGFNVTRNDIEVGLAWYFGRGLWRN